MIPVKGKGMMATYLLLGRKGEGGTRVTSEKVHAESERGTS